MSAVLPPLYLGLQPFPSAIHFFFFSFQMELDEHIQEIQEAYDPQYKEIPLELFRDEEVYAKRFRTVGGRTGERNRPGERIQFLSIFDHDWYFRAQVTRLRTLGFLLKPITQKCFHV